MKGIVLEYVFVFIKTINKWINFVCLGAILIYSCEQKERPPGIEYGLREVPVSIISTTIDLPVSALSQGLNNSLSGILAEESIELNKRGEKLFLTIEKNRDIKLAYRAGQLFAAVPVKVSAVVEKKVLGMKISNGDQPLKFSATVNFSGPFDLDENWQPSFDFKLRSLEWERAPIFDILGFRLDLTSTIDRQVKEFGPKLNATINESLDRSIDLTANIQKAWQKMQEPIKLSVEGDNFYFRMNMSSVRASISSQKTDTLSLDVQANFISELTQKLQDRQHSKLPKKQSIEKKTQPLEVYVDTRLSFKFLNKKAAEFVGRAFDIEGREVIIKSTRIFPRDGYVYSEVAFSGDSDGRITLYGIPAVDENRDFTIGQFGYDLSSDDELLKLTDAALHSGFEKMIQEMISVPLLDQLPILESEISKGIKRSKAGEKLSLNLNVNDLDLYDLGITDSDLQMIWKTEGTAEIQLKKGIFSKARRN
jgi:hypothetical protein